MFLIQFAYIYPYFVSYTQTSVGCGKLYFNL